ncbi:MAG: hypothetical protein V3V96_16425 [Acidiferrobacterales bacterium]
MLTCKRPDRHCPGLVCGYPLPCPHHTAAIDLVPEPPTITIPTTARAAWRSRRKLIEIAETLKDRDHE